MIDKDVSQLYQSIKGFYDASINYPSNEGFNELKGKIDELKTSNVLSEGMYKSINQMEQKYSNILDGLEKKLY